MRNESEVPSMFQSTRPRGARRWRCQQQRTPPKFQSTRPRGARPGDDNAQLVLCVSIHAPTWGATNQQNTTMTDFLFQSTRPRGARPYPTIIRQFFYLFQSTRPRGARRVAVTRQWALRCFNPRAHVGRDPNWDKHIVFEHKFQSTRPRGARPIMISEVAQTSVSIHAPTWGATTSP